MSIAKISITNMGQIVPKHTAAHQPYEFDRYDVSGLVHDGKCTVTFYSIDPGKANYPYHYHTANEEVFYIISGHGLLETPEGETAVAAGDVIVCSSGEKGAHRLTNNTESETLTYLDVDTNNLPDTVIYPRANKTGVFLKGEAPKFYLRDSDVPYYEGE